MTTTQPTPQSQSPQPSQSTQQSQLTASTDHQPEAVALPVPPPPPALPTTWPKQHGQSPQPPSPPQFGRMTQFLPPPQFGRLPHSIQLRETARLQEPAPSPQADTGAQTGPTPHTVHLEPPLRPSDVGELGAVEGPQRLAGFGARAISFLIDYVAPVIVLNLLISLGVVTGSPSLAVVGCLGLLGFGVWNSGYLQGTTGRSLGRRVANTKLVTIETGRPVGFGGAVARQICHALEFGIGYLWPLWDGKRQTFADKIAGTVVIRVDPEPRTDADRSDSATP